MVYEVGQQARKIYMQFGVSESVEHWGKYRSDAPAICHDNILLTYGELNSLVDAMCAILSRSNISSERIAIAIESKLHFLVSLLAVLRLGKSAVILNIGLSRDVLYVNIRDTEVTAVIHDSKHNYIKQHTKPRDSVYSINVDELLLSRQTPNQFYSFETSVWRQRDDEWGVMFSSGTTGIPKGIERDHDSVTTELLGWCLELGLNRYTSFYIGRPVYYTGGLVLMLSTLLVAGTVYLNDYKDSNDHEEIWQDYQRTLSEHKLTWAFFIPSQIRSFIRIAKQSRSKPASAKTILAMGELITGEEKRDVVRILGSEIVESWGNSESLGTSTDPEDVRKVPDSIGRPFLTDKMYIVDDNGVPVKPYEYGRIAGSEEAGFSQYSNRPEETERVKRNNLIISDDIGYIDKDGFFYVCGRKQDTIITKDKVIFLPDLEHNIRSSDLVEECCVIVRTYKDGSFRFSAVIVPSSTSERSEPEFLENLNKILEEDTQLESVLLTDTMPRVASGKIDRRAIDQMLERGKG